MFEKIKGHFERNNQEYRSVIYYTFGFVLGGCVMYRCGRIEGAKNALISIGYRDPDLFTQVVKLYED